MLGRKSFLVFIGSMLTSALGFVCLFFINHYIGVDRYGTVIMITSILATINVVTDLGFSSAHIKKISEGCDVNDCVSTYAIIKINLTCIFIIFSFLAIIIWVGVFGGEMTDTTRDVLLVILAFEVFINLSSIALNTFQGTSEVTKVQIIQILNPLVRLPLIIIIAFTYSNEVLLALTYTIMSMVVLVVSLILIRRSKLTWKRPTLFKPYIKFTIPLILMTLITTLYTNLDKILIGFSIGNSAVGTYSTVQTLLAVLAIVGAAVSVLIFPNFSMLFAQGNIREIRKKTMAGERYISMISMPIVVLFIVFPTEVLTSLFGSNLWTGGEALRFMVIAMFLSMLNQVYSPQILAANQPQVLARATIIGFVIGVVLLFLLVPDEILGFNTFGMGLQGAGLALLGSTVAQFITVRLAVRNISHVIVNKRLALHVVSAVLTGAVLYLVSLILPVNSIPVVIIMSVVSFAAFFTSMILMKEFHRSDIAYFLEIMNPKKMSDYIVSEMSNKNK